jgi:hypothetical protein
MLENITYIWGAGSLIALYGIWYTVHSRLGKTNGGGNTQISRKEREERERDAEIEARAIRRAQQMLRDQESEAPARQPKSPPTRRPIVSIEPLDAPMIEAVPEPALVRGNHSDPDEREPAVVRIKRKYERKVSLD